MPLNEGCDPCRQRRRRTIPRQFVKKVRIGVGDRNIPRLHLHVVPLRGAAASPLNGGDKIIERNRASRADVDNPPCGLRRKTVNWTGLAKALRRSLWRDLSFGMQKGPLVG